ncbi:MAG: hypothetical protein LBI10_01840 [Deltaproteobacteria bacterium]|jgi:chromosome segregation ATPase|nr:hypothetical protein [Deltaproteobacteria bacterium]
MDFSKFDLLETRLGALLDRLKGLENVNQTLNVDLKAALDELDSTKRRLNDLVKTNDAVVARIDALLERLTQAGLSG